MWRKFCSNTPNNLWLPIQLFLAVPKRHCTSNKQIREFFSLQTFYQGPIMIMYQFCRSRLCHQTQKARRLKKLLLVKARSRSCRGRRRRTGFFSSEKFSFFGLALRQRKKKDGEPSFDPSHHVSLKNEEILFLFGGPRGSLSTS